jgi:hypothetical protein
LGGRIGGKRQGKHRLHLLGMRLKTRHVRRL